MANVRKGHVVTWLCGSATDSCSVEELTPVKAIRRKCLDCSGGSYSEVRQCVIRECPLYPYRDGHRPDIQDFDSGALHVGLGGHFSSAAGKCDSGATRQPNATDGRLGGHELEATKKPAKHEA